MTGEDSIPDATHSCHTKPPLWTGIGLFGPYYSLFLEATRPISESDDDLLNRIKATADPPGQKRAPSPRRVTESQVSADNRRCLELSIS